MNYWRSLTPYRPCSNGQVERYNRTLLQLIRCHLKGKWDEDLPILTGALRSLPNRSTGLTPNLMMLGREVRQPMDLVFDFKGNDGPTSSHTSMSEILKTTRCGFPQITGDTIPSKTEIQTRPFRSNTKELGALNLNALYWRTSTLRMMS